MIQLVYASTATVPFTSPSLRTLLVQARERNSAADISGMLLHVESSFLQVLEGDPVSVNALFDRITVDRRHRGVVALVRRELAERNFPDWSMGFFDASGRASSLLGYRKAAGFADLIGDSATTERIIADFREGRWRSLAA